MPFSTILSVAPPNIPSLLPINHTFKPHTVYWIQLPHWVYKYYFSWLMSRASARCSPSVTQFVQFVKYCAFLDLYNYSNFIKMEMVEQNNLVSRRSWVANVSLEVLATECLCRWSQKAPSLAVPGRPGSARSWPCASSMPGLFSVHWSACCASLPDSSQPILLGHRNPRSRVRYFPTCNESLLEFKT